MCFWGLFFGLVFFYLTISFGGGGYVFLLVAFAETEGRDVVVTHTRARTHTATREGRRVGRGFFLSLTELN